MKSYVFGVFVGILGGFFLGFLASSTYHLSVDHSDFNKADIITGVRVIDEKFPEYTRMELAGEYSICIKQNFEDCKRLNETLAQVFERKNERSVDEASKPVLAEAIANMILGFDYSDPMTVEKIGFLLSK